MKRLAILIVFFLANIVTYAQVANDDCYTAQTLIPSTVCNPVSGTLLNARTSTSSTLCTGNSDVYYKFVATSSTATITVDGDPGLDVVVGLFNTCSNSGNLYCVDRLGDGGAETINASGLYPGSTYYIKVQAYDIYLPYAYTFTICLVSAPPPKPPVNEECVNATVLIPTAIYNPITGTLQNATTSLNTACYGYNDVFYKFTANATSATITVVCSSGLDATVGLLNSCGASTSLYCRDGSGSGGVETIYATGLTIGATYYIKVQSYSYSLYTYSFTVAVQSISMLPPPNDNCSDAINLTPSPLCVYTSGTLLNATSSSVAGDCLGNKDVFYSFEATESTATVSVFPSAGMNASVNVFSSCNGGGFVCADASGLGGQEDLIITGLNVGYVYIIQVQNSGSTIPTTSDFSICVIGAIPPPPINDECADAIAIYPTVAYNPITGTVKSATISTVTPSCTGNSDVFYKFKATARTATIKVVGSSGFDPVIGLFKSCGTSYVDCADFDYNTGGTEVMTPTNLIVGTTYYIKVQSYGSTLPTTNSFTIAVQSAEAIPTGTDASVSIQQINMYPNPTQNILNIEHVQTETTIELLDVRGSILLQKNISSDDQIDLSEFAAGVYILKLSVNGVTENRRVVVTK